MTLWFAPFSFPIAESRQITRAILLLVLGLLLVGCSTIRAAELPYVDLDKRMPLPAAIDSEVAPLRLAIAAIISPQGTVESYQALADYLQDEFGRPVELIQRRTYAEVNDLIAKGQVDMAFVCTSAYVDGQNQFGMELLAAPEINGELAYYSELIVPADSDAASMVDLKGKTFAFTDPMSFTGRVYPTDLIQQLGADPDKFFDQTFFAYSHDRAIESVAAGIADGAAVDSLVLDYAVQREPDILEKVKVIHRSKPFGIPPVVVPPNLPPRQKQRLQDTLLSMHENPRGRGILDELGIDRFVVIDDGAYDEVRRLILETGELR
jgi:phosphonate transport system substrate-binding protein